GQKMAGLVVVISDIHALGLATANGLVFTTAFYWDRDEASRVWSKRFFERTDARNGSGRNLFSGAALSQGDAGSGDGRRQGSRRQNKGVAGRRFLRQRAGA